MKTATCGEPLCTCVLPYRDYYPSDPSRYYHDPCTTRGCSVGTNPDCNTGDFSVAYGDYDGIQLDYIDPVPSPNFGIGGCNCPGNHVNLSNNAHYGDGIHDTVFYNYDTCTDIGSIAYSTRPHVSQYATDCCNLCCRRNDPYFGDTTTTISTSTPKDITTTASMITTTPVTTTASTSASNGQSVLDKSLYLSGLMMSALAVLKIN